MNLSPLRGRKVVDRVRRRGDKWRGKHMQVTYVMGAPRLSTQLCSFRASKSGAKVEDERVERQRSFVRGKQGIFLGTSASIKLNKSAVKRNRMRRRCREALRITAKELNKLPTCQLIMSPRSSSLVCDFTELRSDAEAFFAHLNKHAS